MARDAAIQLLQAVEQNQDLREKFTGIDDADRFVELAAEAGYEFTPAELEDVLAQLSSSAEMEVGDLSEQELAQAVGGALSTGYGTSGLKHLAGLKFKKMSFFRGR